MRWEACGFLIGPRGQNMKLLSYLGFAWSRSRLLRTTRKRPSPGAFESAGAFLEKNARYLEALEVAREGLKKYPFSRRLQDILKSSWKQYAGLRAAELDAKIRQRGEPQDFIDLIDFHLGHLELDSALTIANRMNVAHPVNVESWHWKGQAHLHLFLRDHLSQDGREAIELLKKAAEAAPESFPPRLSLAEAYYHIGATSKAIFQVLVAIELSPEDPQAQDLYNSLLQLPPETDDERELLWLAEENDESWVRSRRRPGGEKRRAEITRGMGQLSSMGGIHHVVLCHRTLELVARKGAARIADETGDRGLVNLASGFRRSASLALKRMGLGAMTESRLIMDEGSVIVLGAGSSVLMIVAQHHPRNEVIAEEARKYLTAWTGVQVTPGQPVA